MKTLFLHIGIPKTATSSIQAFCAKNREVLKSKNYCYPHSVKIYPNIGKNRNAHFMVGTSQNKGGGPMSPEEQQIFELGMEHLHSCFQEADNVILSDEGIWYTSGRSRQNLWKDLKADAQEHGYVIKIIVYLRRQDQFFCSRYKQFVKQNGYAVAWDQYIKTAPKALDDILDYASKINHMAEIFGKENVCVRRFDRSCFYKGSIYADFFQCLGLEITDEYQKLDSNVNLSFNGNAFEIMRVANTAPGLDRHDNAYLRKLIGICSKESEEHYPASLFSREEAEAFIGHYREGNEQIAADFIGDGKPLFDYDVAETLKWEKENEYMLEDVIRLFAVTTYDLHQEVVRLKEETKRLRTRLDTTMLQRLKRFIRRMFK